MNEITSYIHYGEYDYNKRFPILVIQGDFGSAGYSIDVDSGRLTRTCICHAREDTECVCGYFNEQCEDYIE